MELNHNTSLTINNVHHSGSTEGAGDIGRQRLTPGKSPTRSGGRSRRKPEAQFRGMNSMRKLKWERAGLREDMVRYLEVRDYTPADVIQAHYTEAIKRRRSNRREGQCQAY